MSNEMGSADNQAKVRNSDRTAGTFVSGIQGSYILPSFAAGMSAGAIAGLADIFFPAALHNLLFYSAVYGSIVLFSAVAAYMVTARLWVLRAIGIASVSMGIWAIVWTAYYAVFRYPVWYHIFIITKTLGIGLGYSVSIETYVFSTAIQSLGGGVVILLSTPRLFQALTGIIRKPSGRF